MYENLQDFSKVKFKNIKTIFSSIPASLRISKADFQVTLQIVPIYILFNQEHLKC